DGARPPLKEGVPHAPVVARFPHRGPGGRPVRLLRRRRRRHLRGQGVVLRVPGAIRHQPAAGDTVESRRHIAVAIAAGPGRPGHARQAPFVSEAPMKLADTWSLVKDAGIEFMNDKGPRLGAALAYYIALSLSPLLLVVIAIAGAVFGEDAARGEVAHQIQDLVGQDGAKAIQSMLASEHSTGTGILWTIVGITTLVIGASGVFAQLQEGLDTVWHVQTA